jgi:asparagine synthase (glutamine-hydrolysing)
MSEGFTVTRLSSDSDKSNISLEGLEITIGKSLFYIDHENCLIVKLDSGGIVLFDGYTFPDKVDVIVDIVCAGEFHKLSTLEGHFSGVFINDDSIIGFNDRFGGKTLYWQYYEDKLILTSRINLMPIYDTDLDPVGVNESLNFRWTTGESTLLSATKKLMAHHTIVFSENTLVKQINYQDFPQLKPNNLSLEEKIQQTKKALKDNLIKASKRYKKVAVFLSGGVDSSLLAALSTDVFEECLLITPVFKNGDNPELPAAIAFAEKLGLTHQLVEINPAELEEDLIQLIKLKREPLRHYSSLAMIAMMRSVPDNVDAVIYGEGADTLFGSNGVNRFITRSKWKEKSQHVPLFLLELFKKLVPGRGDILLKLKNQSYKDILLTDKNIKYSPQELFFIEQLLVEKNREFNNIHCEEPALKMSRTKLRHIAQEQNLNSSCVVHFAEAEVIAEFYGKHIISPFMDPKAIEIATTLNDKDYFGDSYVKPVLREIACEYFSRELIYQEKHGFPVPLVDWLHGYLKNLVDNVKNEQKLFNGSKLEGMSIEENYEIYWLLINWQITNELFEKEKC